MKSEYILPPPKPIGWLHEPHDSAIQPIALQFPQPERGCPPLKKKRCSKGAKRWLSARKVNWATQNNKRGEGRRGTAELRVQIRDGSELRSLPAEQAFSSLSCSYSHQVLFATPRLMNGLCKASPSGRQLAADHQPPLFLAFVSSRVGWGAYAARDIACDEIIGRYTGVVCEIEQGNPYSLAHHELGESHAIDATHYGNETRFVNHSSNPNCIFAPSVSLEGVPEMLLVATQAIPKGAQVLTDYGDDFWQGAVPEELV